MLVRGELAKLLKRRAIGGGFSEVADERQNQVVLADRIKKFGSVHRSFRAPRTGGGESNAIG